MKNLPAILIILFLLLHFFSFSTRAQSAAEKPYIEEWVYRVKYGYKDEWWKIFQKYQLAILQKEKEIGYVISYAVYCLSLHISEDSRWDYQIEVVFKNREASTHGSEVEKGLFPDRAAMRNEENRRWELTTNHWDMPIHLVNPDTGD